RLPERRVPLDVLVDVSLKNGYAEPVRRLRERESPCSIGETQEQGESSGQGGSDGDLPARPAEGDGNGGYHDNDEERDAVHAGDRRDLDQREVARLSVGEEGPGESRQGIGPRELQGHPEASRQKDLPDSRGGVEPYPARRKGSEVESKVKGQEEREERTRAPRKAGVHTHGMRGPGEVQRVENHPGERPEPESGTARGPIQGHEERHQRDERNGRDSGRGEDQRQGRDPGGAK